MGDGTVVEQEKLLTSLHGKKQTAKIHVSVEIANLLKIYCVLNNKKMVEFATEMFSRELKEFRERLEEMRKVG